MGSEPPFTISRAAQLADLKIGMVDYLCRERIVIPSASKHRVRGKPRLYSFSDVVMLRTVGNLLKRGVSARRLRDALKSLRKRYPGIQPNDLPFRYLVTDGKWAMVKTEKEVLENLNKGGQFEFSFVVDIQPIHDQVLERMKLPSPPRQKRRKQAA